MARCNIDTIVVASIEKLPSDHLPRALSLFFSIMIPSDSNSTAYKLIRLLPTAPSGVFPFFDLNDHSIRMIRKKQSDLSGALSTPRVSITTAYTLRSCLARRVKKFDEKPLRFAPDKTSRVEKPFLIIYLHRAGKSVFETKRTIFLTRKK